jgi:SAM-dependent methyltransferase
MPEAPLNKAESGELPLIDHCFEPTHDEIGRQRFVSALRKFVLTDMRAQLKDAYDTLEAPAFKAKHGRAPRDGREADRAMERNDVSRAYGAMRYNAQEMVWASVQDPIERALPEMISIARQAAVKNPSGGSLTLDPALPIPRHVSALDVHLIPGCFHTEHTADDVAQGAVTAFGGGVFAGGLPWRKDGKGRNGGVAESVAHYLKMKYPDFAPRRILDLGTSSGKNLFPYADVYPDAEIHGIDVAAPLLRYGHAQAEAFGVKVHFSQQNAERAKFPDGYFDLIVSSFFFHEIPVKITRNMLAECNRLLAPGGHMAHMELPPQKAMDPFMNFFWDWDTLNNNEPSYTAFRGQDPTALCAGAGFAKDRCFEITIPNRATFGDEKFARFVAGQIPPPEHGSGGWFIFGARK